jgi:hypothetical protein
MSIINVAGQSGELKTFYTLTQTTIAMGAGALFSNPNGYGLCTLTFNSAHGLTFSPAAGVPANFFLTFSGASAQTGVGTLNGNYFRILAIPSTTTIQIYSTITAATLTGATAIPVFFPDFGAAPLSGNSGAGPLANLTGNAWLGKLGANAEYFWNNDGTIILLDQFTTPAGGTPATAPAVTLVTSGGPFFHGRAPWGGIMCLGSAGTTYLQALS